MEKDQILEKLSKLPLYKLSEMLDTKQLELKDAIAKLATARDEEHQYKFKKRKELLNDGNGFSKVENMLRVDPTLYEMKRKVMLLSTAKKQLDIELDIIRNYYWSAKQGG